MKPDQERVKTLLSQTVTLLCKNGLHFEKELRIQGLLGITIDSDSVFIVHFNETLTDFASESTLPPVEICTVEKLKPASTSSLTNSHTLRIETGTEKSLSYPAEVSEQSLLHESSQMPVLKNEMTAEPEEEEEDMTAVKLEPVAGEDGDEVVLVESENEEDIKDDGHTELNSRHDRKHRMQPQVVSQRGKRRRLALPAPVENMSAYDEGGNYSMKMEPASSHYLDSGEQTAVYDDSYTDPSWENSKSVFGHGDNETLEELPGCSSWDGFDLQSRGLTSTSSVDRNSELFHESWTYAKYERRGTTPMQTTFSRSRVSSPSDDSVALRQAGAVATFRRSRGGGTVKTVVCQYPDCGKTFCHSYHLYRHQREKHGRRFGVISQMSFMCRFPECGRVFYRMASLWNHESLVHNVTPSPT